MLFRSERLFRFGHVVDDLVECLDGLLHFVVLRGDEGHVVIVALGVGRDGEVGPCRVSQAAGFAHLLEDDGVHASAEILVVEGDLRVGCKVEFLAAVRILHVVELLGVVLGKHDLVFIGGLQRAELFFQRLIDI